ncbi:type I restriction-modification system, S subunit [Mycoplasma haemofelis str. Langford 1]|uniref:Type I restriction modification DNA specificity domain-containing protein n=2 Tax=Mycoplasma haemofelis TaxID=29501 RepID=F6FIJ7_MYCHI|nr:restriction endonuclease subunit S [Mycoplasma haemofelis]AEG73045.1 hypothetical protein MHF_0776 [Mycoplasma haemofelis Ohio2]CBY92710.1 type I restriction-modification system, S subunit [Mycoplasma haemofelis str. Langford 1]
MSSFSSLLEEVKDVKYLKLGEVCRIVLCGTVFGRRFYKDSGFPVLKTSDIWNGQIVTDDLSYCDPKNHPNANIIKRGDVVITNVGKVAINLTDQEFFFISTIFKLVPRKDVLIAKYLYHFLLENPEEVDRLIREGRLRKSDLKELAIPVPSSEIQARIVNSLDSNFSKTTRVHSEEITNDTSLQETVVLEHKSFWQRLKSFFGW